MDDKTMRLVAAGGVIFLVIYLLKRQSETAGRAKTVSRPPPSAGAGQTSTLVKEISSLGGLINSVGGFFKSSSSGPAVPMSTTGASLSNPTFGGSGPTYNPAEQNAVSNALADETAASDDASGMVGFGGWDN